MSVNTNFRFNDLTSAEKWGFGLATVLSVGTFVVGIAMGSGAFGERLSFSGSLHNVSRAITIVGGVATAGVVYAALRYHVNHKERKKEYAEDIEQEIQLSEILDHVEKNGSGRYVTKSGNLYSFSKIDNELEITYLGTVKLVNKTSQQYNPNNKSHTSFEDNHNLQRLDLPSKLQLEILDKLNSLSQEEREKLQNEPLYKIWIDDQQTTHHLFVFHDGDICEASTTDFAKWPG